VETSKSTTGYVFIIANSPVSWRARRQGPIRLLLIEAKYYALTKTAREATWLRLLLSELFYKKANLYPTRVFSDNIPLYTLTENPEYYSRLKHIRV
jgi:hypothetical protein